MMKIGSVYSKKVLLVLTAWLLMSVFLSIPMFQVFHNHTSYTEHCRTSNNQIKISSHSKCEICDYLLHTLNKQAFQAPATELIVLAVKYIVRKGVFACAISEQCIQAFTNKGPPLLS